MTDKSMRVDVPEGADFHLSNPMQPKATVYPAFLSMGTGADRYYCIGYGNLKKAWQSLSKNALWLLWELIDVRQYKTNIAKFTAANPVEQNKINRGYPELFKLDFLVRIKRSHYFMNPQVVLPELYQYEATQEQYKAYVALVDAKKIIKGGR